MHVFCSWYGNNRMMVLVDCCTVKSGDELCISYGSNHSHIDYIISGPRVGQSTKADRQAKLKKLYYFDCTCKACQKYALYKLFKL